MWSYNHTNELTHHGILGMKWGVRRFQNKDGSLTAKGKKRYGDSDDTEESYEEGKQRALKTGSAQEVLKYKGDLTPQEMRSAMERIKWEQEMQSISDKEVSAGKAKTDKFFNTVENGTKHVNTALKAYNTFANIYNAFNGERPLMPKVDTNISSDNRSQRKAEAKERKKSEEAKKKREEQEAQRETKQKERAAKRAKETAADEDKSSDDKVYTGQVFGGSKKSQTSSNNKQSKKDIIIDIDDWSEVTVNDVPSSTRAIGQKYVSGLLEDKSK